MTCQISALTVILDEPLREDDADLLGTLAAIRRIKGVQSATLHRHSPDFSMAEVRAKVKARDAVIDAVIKALNEI